MPSDIACAINDLFDAHGTMPMTSDIGDCLFTAMEIENTELAAPGYYAGMGFGVPAIRNCTRDEGRPFEFGNQVLISSHRKPKRGSQTAGRMVAAVGGDFLPPTAPTPWSIIAVSIVGITIPVVRVGIAIAIIRRCGIPVVARG